MNVQLFSFAGMGELLFVKRTLQILRTSLPILLGNVGRMGANVLLSKATGYLFGPAGVGLLGQVGSVAAVATSLSTACVDNGVVRHVARARSLDKEAERNALASSLRIVSVATITCLFCGICLLPFIRRHLFLDQLSVAATGTLLLGAAAVASLNWCLAVVNGQRRLWALAGIHMAWSLTCAAAAAYMLMARPRSISDALTVSFLGNIGALALAVPLLESGTLRLAFSKGPLDRSSYLRFLPYSLMSGGSSLIVAGTAILVRSRVISDASLGLPAAGALEAISKLSSPWLGVLTASLSAYYMPRLAVAKSMEAMLREAWSLLRVVAPVAMASGIATWWLRRDLLNLFYSRDFPDDSVAVALQSFGDFLKMVGWTFGYTFIATGDWRRFLTLEASYSMVRVLLTWLGIRYFGFRCVPGAYCASWVFYLAGLAWMLRGMQPVPAR